MEKQIKLIRLLNKLKKKSKATDEKVAALTDGELTSEQVSTMLSGIDESYLTVENLQALEKGILAAHQIYFKKLITKINKRMRKISDEQEASDV
jgi:hypothetical protein